jgi:Leucine-rich repeat (LRR) protein
MADYSIVDLVSNLPTDKFEELSRVTGELMLVSFGRFDSFCSINKKGDFSLSDKTRITSLEGLQQPITSVQNVQNTMRSGLTPLTKLTVKSHNIRSIADVQYLTRLEDLTLNLNQIVSIAGVQFPASLQMLSLEANQIASLQKVVFPPNLKELTLSNNRITSLEGALFPQTLEMLSLDHNQIANLLGGVLPPERFPLRLVSGSESGSELDRDTAVARVFNSFNSESESRPALPPDVAKLVIRHTLQVPCVSRLVSLKGLNLSHNQLTSLDGIDFLTSLLLLNLEDNKLTSLALNLPNLEELVTTNNPVVDYSGLEISESCDWTREYDKYPRLPKSSSNGGKRKKQRKQTRQTKKNNKKNRRKTKKNERRRRRVK